MMTVLLEVFCSLFYNLNSELKWTRYLMKILLFHQYKNEQIFVLSFILQIRQFQPCQDLGCASEKFMGGGGVKNGGKSKVTRFSATLENLKLSNLF